MPVQTIFEKGDYGVGPIGPSVTILLHSGEAGTLRMLANSGTGNNQWDHVDANGDFDLIVEVLVEMSDNGQTWVSHSESIVVGGSHVRNTTVLPGVEIRNLNPGDQRYRVTYNANKSLPLGCNLETP